MGDGVRVRTRRGPARTGYTLIELTVSMGVLSILLAAIGSAIVVAAKALPDASPADELLLPCRVAADIAAELQLALDFTVTDPRTVEFTVTDRDSDTVNETIRYEWSGTAGDPLTRQYNSGTVVTVLDDVQEFDLFYEVIAVPEDAGVIESAEQLLDSTLTGNDSFDGHLRSPGWIGQVLDPPLPGNAISWKVTRLQLRAKKGQGGDGTTLVQLRTTGSNGLPAVAVVAVITLPESTLGGKYAWVEFPFDTEWPAGEALGLVLRWVETEITTGVFEYTTDSTSQFLTGDPSHWFTATGSLYYALYGTYTTPQTDVRTCLTGVRIKLRTSSDPSSRVETGVAMMQRIDITP